MEEEQLAGGVANAGSVTRSGAYVLRPSNPHSVSIHRMLASVRAAGFDGVPNPVGIDADGRERLEFIAGDVAIPPYPAWVQTDERSKSIAVLMRRFHEASRSFDPTGASWSDEMPGPHAGPVVCHNDVCFENVVFRDGVAVALLDFDFAAPGEPIYDLAQCVRTCVPIDDDVNAPRLGWRLADQPARLRVAADAYGLDAAGRTALFDVLAPSIERGGVFVRRRVAAGDPNFVRTWNEMGGEQRFERRLDWWHAHRDEFRRALG